jgi:hypothetical protein
MLFYGVFMRLKILPVSVQGRNGKRTYPSDTDKSPAKTSHNTSGIVNPVSEQANE